MRKSGQQECVVTSLKAKTKLVVEKFFESVTAKFPKRTQHCF